MEEILKIPNRRIPGDRIAVNAGCVSVGLAGLCTGVTVAVKDGEINYEKSQTELYQETLKDTKIDLTEAKLRVEEAEEANRPGKEIADIKDKELLEIAIETCKALRQVGRNEVRFESTGRVIKCNIG